MVKAPFLSQKVVKKRRLVTFAKGCSEVGFQVKLIPSNVSSQEDKQRMHCTKKEKKNMINMAREVADEVYAHDNPHHVTIMGRPPPSNDAYTPIMLLAFESCHSTSPPLNDKELQRLIHWIATGHSRRGLEKISVNGLSDNMGTYRRNAIQTVIEMHAAMANHGYLSAAAQDCISNTYRKFSDPSKKFAALMGHVDAEAVQLERWGHCRNSSPTSVVIVDPVVVSDSCQLGSFQLPEPMTSAGPPQRSLRKSITFLQD